MRTTKKLTRASTNPSGSRYLEFDGSRGRSVTDDGLLELATVLNEPQTNIEGLSLRYMKLSDEVCSALAESIKVNWTLGRFELHGTAVCLVSASLVWSDPYRRCHKFAPGNQMSAASCEKLADALKRHPKLAILEAGCAFSPLLVGPPAVGAAQLCHSACQLLRLQQLNAACLLCRI